MSEELYEEFVSGTGMRYKRKKRKIDIKSQKKSKSSLQAIKELILPKKPHLFDFKKSLEKFDKFTLNPPIISHELRSKKSIKIDKTDIIAYPGLPNLINLNLNSEFYEKEINPALRWNNILKDLANTEYNRIKDVFKKDPELLLRSY